MDDSELGTGASMDPAKIDSIQVFEGTGKAAGDSHIFLITTTDSDGQIAYEAGYGWKKAGAITTPKAWADYLSTAKPTYQ